MTDDPDGAPGGEGGDRDAADDRRDAGAREGDGPGTGGPDDGPDAAGDGRSRSGTGDGDPGDGGDGRTVVLAQGTFDLLHPGHVHYLRAARALGDRLEVVVARADNVTHKPAPVVPARQRRTMVAALAPVARAHMGDPEDIFVPVERVDPDVIALGYDQHHDDEAIAAELDRRGIDCAVRRVSGREPAFEGELLSSGEIVERVLDRRGGD